MSYPFEFQPVRGIVAATYTPFHADGSLRLETIETQAAYLSSQGVTAVFIGGTTGECTSLTIQERIALTKRWTEVTKGSSLGVIVHVGSNCLDDSCAIAKDAQSRGVRAISAFSPSYAKPASLEALVACSAKIAASASNTPFYFYDIPSMTGVSFSMPNYLDHAKSLIPNLVGLKFTNTDLPTFQRCLNQDDGRWDVLFGCDEYLLGAIALGAQGAVGSTYNFASKIYLRMIDAWKRGAHEEASRLQLQSVRLVHLLQSLGYAAAGKAVVEWLGIPVGPPRLPILPLNADQQLRLARELDAFELK